MFNTVLSKNKNYLIIITVYLLWLFLYDIRVYCIGYKYIHQKLSMYIIEY